MGDQVTPAFYPQAQPQQIDSRSLLATATDPAKMIEELRHRLMGQVWNPVKKKWVKLKGVVPIINANGAAELFNAVFVRVNQNTIFSNLTEQEVRKLIIHFCDDLMYLLADKYIEWDIKDEEALNIIFSNVTDTIFFALKRGFEQGERKFLSKVVSQSENIVHHPSGRPNVMDGIFHRK